MLEGILVDLVPYGDAYKTLDHRWHNSEASFYWTMGGRWLHTAAQIRREQQQPGERHRNRVAFGIQTKAAQPIGYFGLHRLMPHQRMAALSAMIGEPDYWGGGYGTDALLLMIDYAFGWLDMRKLWLMTMTANPRVLRQMAKVGMRQESRLREGAYANGAWYDAVTYGLLREEWPGRAALVERLELHPDT